MEESQAERIIEMRDINKYYQRGAESLHALNDVSLTVNRGDFLAILGPSGSGKSTLMNIIGCMDLPDSGEYLLDGVNIGGCSDNALTQIRNEKIGFIFQKYQLIPKYSVLENIALPLLVRGKSRKEAAKGEFRCVKVR